MAKQAIIIKLNAKQINALKEQLLIESYINSKSSKAKIEKELAAYIEDIIFNYKAWPLPVPPFAHKK